MSKNVLFPPRSQVQGIRSHTKESRVDHFTEGTPTLMTLDLSSLTRTAARARGKFITDMNKPPAIAELVERVGVPRGTFVSSVVGASGFTYTVGERTLTGEQLSNYHDIMLEGFDAALVGCGLAREKVTA